jgi:hypothetical protein
MVLMYFIGCTTNLQISSQNCQSAFYDPIFHVQRPQNDMHQLKLNMDKRPGPECNITIKYLRHNIGRNFPNKS